MICNSRPARCAAAFALLWASSTYAQTDRPISQQFRFVTSSIGTAVPVCKPVNIVVERVTPATFGIAPYYMIAYPVNGGTPRRTLLGSNNSTLRWTPTHPAGTTLLLNVVDSTESGGGIPQTFVNVTSGDTTDCVIAPSASPDFIVWSNVTSGPLQTCQPWGIAFDGGVPPYDITIASLDSPTVTNITLEAGFDAYTWINRAPPTSQLVIAVSDSTGRWASGSPSIRTAGGVDVQCAGAESLPGDWKTLGYTRPTVSDSPAGEIINGGGNGGGGGSGQTGGGNNGTNTDGQDDEPKPEETSGTKTNNNNTALIAGITVPVVVVLLAAVAFGIWFMRRKKAGVTKSENDKALYNGGGGPNSPANGQPTLDPFVLARPSPTVTSIQQAPSITSTTYTKQQEVAAARQGQPSGQPRTVGTSSSFYTSGVASSAAFDSERGTSETSSLATRPVMPSLAEARGTFVAQSKAAEAASEAQASSSNQEGYYHSVSQSGDEILIQHKDAGPSIRELPPPYAAPARS